MTVIVDVKVFDKLFELNPSLNNHVIVRDVDVIVGLSLVDKKVTLCKAL